MNTLSNIDFLMVTTVPWAPYDNDVINVFKTFAARAPNIASTIDMCLAGSHWVTTHQDKLTAIIKDREIHPRDTTILLNRITMGFIYARIAQTLGLPFIKLLVDHSIMDFYSVAVNVFSRGTCYAHITNFRNDISYYRYAVMVEMIIEFASLLQPANTEAFANDLFNTTKSIYKELEAPHWIELFNEVLSVNPHKVKIQ